MNTPSLKEARKRTKQEVIIEKCKSLTQSQKRLGVGKTYFIKTYGCQMNEHDSENMKALLEQMQFQPVENMEDADVVLLNTCAIRENAHNKVFGLLGRVKHAKQTKEVIVGLCGCMAQEEIVVNQIIEKYPWLDFVFGTHNIDKLPDVLEKTIKNHKQEIDVYSCEGNVIEDMPVKRDNPYKAWVNIMYGCDKFCTYCIVPYTRGKQRSRLPEYILKEVKDLQEHGYQEVTLLGQNVNAYGKDLNIGYTMANLLEEVAKLGIPRIRFVTSHPWDFNEDMIKVIEKYDNIMPYIHLPLQSGSNSILKKMGRRYTKESYLELFHKLKEIMPNCSITTDIIVGFPNETEQDFQDTLDVVKECKFDSAFTFIFSPREGTPASKMIDSIPLEVKEQRLYALNEIVNQYSKMNNDKYLNKIVPVLLEEVSSKKQDRLKGYTDTMKLVNVKAPISYLGKIVNVKITSVKTWSMDGEIVE